MATATLTENEELKRHQARRLSERMGEFLLEYDPTGVLAFSASNLKGDPSTKGHAFELKGASDCEFPGFGFSVLIDGRANNSDLAQTVVDELFAIANAYMAVAKRNAARLNREPKPIKYRWEDHQPAIDWELQEYLEQRTLERVGE
ncbi:hypothetical protein [Aeoliella sp. SH292]|uniref:hypothetical protein n=1 Tax=Aeoliella sp. SH292 TaxID=3454464 RepID=UPI003F961C2B